MVSHSSISNYWKVNSPSKINYFRSVQEPSVYSIAPSPHVYVAPIQNISSVCDFVKMTDFIDGKACFFPSTKFSVSDNLSSKQSFNEFENDIQTSVLAATLYKSEGIMSNTEYKLDVSTPPHESLTYSTCSQELSPSIDLLKQEKTDVIFSQENIPSTLDEKSVKKSSQSSKISSRHKDRRKNFFMELLDSLQITTGISGKPYSYAQLITYAIATSSTQKMTLSELYKWCMDNFPYFKETPSQGWKNSIRHNLSLNRNFIRVPRPVNEPGKGSYWTLNRARIKSEMKALNRTRNHKRSNTTSTNVVTFDRIVNLNGENDASEFYNYSCPLQQTEKTLSQPQVNFSDSSTICSPSSMQQVFQSYFVQCDPVANKNPSSVSVSMQSCNTSHCDTNQQTDLQSCLDSTYYLDTNKTQDELLFNLLQYQQFKVQQTHKNVEYDNGVCLDRQLPSCHSDFQPLMEEIGGYDNICFTQEH